MIRRKVYLSESSRLHKRMQIKIIKNKVTFWNMVIRKFFSIVQLTIKKIQIFCLHLSSRPSTYYSKFRAFLTALKL